MCALGLYTCGSEEASLVVLHDDALVGDSDRVHVAAAATHDRVHEPRHHPLLIYEVHLLPSFGLHRQASQPVASQPVHCARARYAMSLSVEDGIDCRHVYSMHLLRNHA